MDLGRTLAPVREAFSETRVFGEPYERDNVTVITAAAVSGGGGGGAGSRGDGEHPEEGSGGGFGVSARPAGAYVIREGTVAWQPAVDVNRVVLGGQVVAVVALLTLTRLARARRARRAAERRRAGRAYARKALWGKALRRLR